MKNKLLKILSILLCFCLIFEQSIFAQVAAQLDIVGHLTAMRNGFSQDVFRPLHLRYLSYKPQENNFRIFLDKGSQRPPSNDELKATTKTLLSYFFIGLSLPNDAFWVNLRPDSPDNIIDPLLAQTDIGKIMLETDLQLKKDTAAMTSPQTPQGKLYWDKLYKKAKELFGNENITIPTLTRPWIVPGEIIIRETTDSAYIYKATLKVMLEQDYLKDSVAYKFDDPRLKALNEYSSQLIRELIIPKLTQEVNSSKRYASLRQVYYSLILAQWFKARNQGKNNQYARMIDRKDLTSLSIKMPYNINTYFNAYKESFSKGEYNIQEQVPAPFGQTIRSYMSGGEILKCPIPQLGEKSDAIVSSPAIDDSNILEKDKIVLTIDGIFEKKLPPGMGESGFAEHKMQSALGNILTYSQSMVSSGMNTENESNVIPFKFKEYNNLLNRFNAVYKKTKDHIKNSQIEPTGKAEILKKKIWGKNFFIIHLTGHYSKEAMDKFKAEIAPSFLRDITADQKDAWLFLVEGAHKNMTPENIFLEDLAKTFEIDLKEPIVSPYNAILASEIAKIDPLKAIEAILYMELTGEGNRVEDVITPSLSRYFNRPEESIEGIAVALQYKINNQGKETIGRELVKVYKKLIVASNDLSYQNIQRIIKDYPSAENIFVLAGGAHLPIFDEGYQPELKINVNDLNSIVSRIESLDMTAETEIKDDFEKITKGIAVPVDAKVKFIYHAKLYPDYHSLKPTKLAYADKTEGLVLEVRHDVDRNEVWLKLQITKATHRKIYDGMPPINKGESSWVRITTDPKKNFPIQITSSPTSDDDGGKGGIDFTHFPIVTQAATNLSANLNPQAMQNLISVNLNTEWLQLECLVSLGITPSSERIKEYMQASCIQDNIIQDREKIILYISDILRKEEELYSPTESLLRDILVLLDSTNSTQQLKAVFIGAIP